VRRRLYVFIVRFYSLIVCDEAGGLCYVASAPQASRHPPIHGIAYFTAVLVASSRCKQPGTPRVPGCLQRQACSISASHRCHTSTIPGSMGAIGTEGENRTLGTARGAVAGRRRLSVGACKQPRPPCVPGCLQRELARWWRRRHRAASGPIRDLKMNVIGLTPGAD